MSMYDQNLAIINKYNPSVYQAIIGENATGDIIEYIPNIDNYRITRDSISILLHSVYDREREFNGILRSVEQTDKTVILFGLGNGQLLSEIHKRFPLLGHLIVVEPNVEIIRQFLHNQDFIKAFRIFNKVSFILGKSLEEAKESLSELVHRADILEKKISLVALVGYRTLYADYYNVLSQETIKALRFYRVNTITKETFRWHWLINSLRNLKHVSPDISSFQKIFANSPAIIVSAGPSLQKNIHLLKKAKDRALIIAVGSAMTILESHGIVPHFRIAVDAGVENKMLFDKIDTSSCPLIYNDHLYYDILPNYSGPKVHMPMPATDLLVRYIFAKIDRPILAISSGFSVANIALNLLVRLQCSPIVLMGQDLCYTRGKMHAEGAWDEEFEEKYIKKDIEAIDIDGNHVFTDRAFLGMKKLFEDSIALYPEVRVLNATEGGLAICGAENVKLETLLNNELLTTRDITKAIQEVLQAEECGLAEKSISINTAIKDIYKNVIQILNMCNKINEKYVKIYQWIKIRKNKERVLSETQKLRYLVMEINNLEFYSKVILPVFEDQFHVRRQITEFAHDDWRQQWEKEIGILLLELQDVKEYLLRMKDLIDEYHGKHKINIIFEELS